MQALYRLELFPRRFVVNEQNFRFSVLKEVTCHCICQALMDLPWGFDIRPQLRPIECDNAEIRRILDLKDV